MKTLTLKLVFCLILIQGLTSLAFAQDNTDAYDPFIDYNEFEIADEEEADINFFRHGRFLTAGFLFGQRSFTQGMSEVFVKDVVYGLYLSYFFDLRFALQLGYSTGSHAIGVSGGGKTVTGDTKISGVSLDLKYYFNTQNVTKGLASLNPYVIGGFTSFTRQSVVDGQPEFSKDDAMGFNMGAGIEIPFLRNKMYFGAQGMYQVVNFRDENSQIELDGGTIKTNKYPNGDFITFMGILGVNF
jgi:hypothetical protein